MAQHKKQLIISIDCEGEFYTKLSDTTMEQSVQNVAELIEEVGDKADIILMSTLGFLKKAYLMKLMDKWLSFDNIIAGFHLHPDDLPEEIIEGQAFYDPSKKFLTEYNYEEQLVLIKKCIVFMKEFNYKPLWFRGGFYSMNDSTIAALTECSDIVCESHNIHRKEYNVTCRGIRNFESYPVMAEDDYNELRFERFSLNQLIRLKKNNNHQYEYVVGMTHSTYLNEKIRKRIRHFILKSL